jgi:hypothetical protein
MILTKTQFLDIETQTDSKPSTSLDDTVPNSSKGFLLDTTLCDKVCQ